MKRLLAEIVCSFCVGSALAVDWPAVNAAAREQAKTPIRAGVPGQVPFWTVASKAFIHPPAFDVPETAGATSYVCTLTDGQGHVDTWTAEKPWRPIPSDIWDAKKPGYYTFKVGSFERKFYRAAIFHGPYPAAKSDYRTVAARVYAAVFHLPQVQAWLTDPTGDPPKGYDLYCYPSKILSSMIRALIRHAANEPRDAEKALAISRKMADWLIAHRQPATAALPFFTPTYWGDRRKTAADNAGLNMLSYPAQAANACFDLAVATHETKYREAALAIVRTYAKLQGPDGTWPLKVRESDGTPTRANRLLPGRYIYQMFDFACAFDASLGPVRDRAFTSILQGPVKTWNWDGQFEDMDPMPPYRDMQKGVAIDTAERLFAQGDRTTACELVDWCEDQFTVWSDPIHNMDWRHWKTPTALEQYDYYTPIDASMADMIRGFAAAFRATGKALYLEKAKALADNITRHQRADGTIPTYFDNRGGSDWVNCMVYVAHTLETFGTVAP